jgi:predicted enzyme involved in methoxymalonyl-ACP biosynthesis
MPEVLTLLLPAEPDDIPVFLKHVWAFDHDASTDEDRHRTQLYHQHFLREEVRDESQSLEEFIAKIGVKGEISPDGRGPMPTCLRTDDEN